MSNTFPDIRVFQWDTSELSSPVGLRNIPGGSPAFQRMVSSGCSTFNPNLPSTTSGVLLFENTKFDLTNLPLPSHLVSKTTAITFNLSASGEAMSDIKLYIADESALLGSKDEGNEQAIVQFSTRGSSWLPNLVLASGSVSTLPTTVPLAQNVFRQDGGNALVGEDDGNSSEFIYLNMIIPLGYPLGTYGACGSGNLRMSIIFNYWCNDWILQFGDVG